MTASNLKLAATLLLSSGVVLAAGSGGHGSPMDLIFPAANVIILASFLIFKLKKPLRDHFVGRSNEIKNSLERAQVKSKEADLMMQKQKEKLDYLPTEIEEMNTNAQKELTKFKSNLTEEFTRKEEKLKEDTMAKLEAEKRLLYDQLCEKVFAKVVDKTKDSIDGNPSVKNDITSNLLKAVK
jgi:F0F1-type ATP synthase membrane subunit b/b'